MINELNQARKHLDTIYTMDELDSRAKDTVNSILAKASSYVSELEKDNKKLREFIEVNIA